MKLSEWQAKLRNASAPLAPAPTAPPRERPWTAPVVVDDSGALDERFEIILPLDKVKATGDVLKRLADAGYADHELMRSVDRDVLKDVQQYQYWLASDFAPDITVLVARVEVLHDGEWPVARLTVPPRKPSAMKELVGTPLNDPSRIIAAFLADARQFGAWPRGTYVKDVIVTPETIVGQITTADGAATKHFSIELGTHLKVTCAPWPLATAEVSPFALLRALQRGPRVVA